MHVVGSLLIGHLGPYDGRGLKGGEGEKHGDTCRNSTSSICAHTQHSHTHAPLFLHSLRTCWIFLWEKVHWLTHLCMLHMLLLQTRVNVACTRGLSASVNSLQSAPRFTSPITHSGAMATLVVFLIAAVKAEVCFGSNGFKCSLYCIERLIRVLNCEKEWEFWKRSVLSTRVMQISPF